MNSTVTLKTSQSKQQEALCQIILAYFKRHPNAEDTLEGIAWWWLLEQRVQDETARVKAALNCLEGRKQLLARRGADGRIYYSLLR